MKLEGQAGIVTGGGRGIGRAIARALAAEGMAIAVAARSQDQLAETVSLISAAGGRAVPVQADVTDRDAVEGLVERCLAEFGQIDLLLNNAGSFRGIGPVWEVDPSTWWTDVSTNLLGAFLSCRSVLPHMIARGRGKIINMAGGGSVSPLPYGSSYGCSKAAILRFTDTLAKEVESHGIEVYAMSPGLVRTAMTEYNMGSAAGKKWYGHLAGRFAQGLDVPPSEACRVAVFLATLPNGDLSGRLFRITDDLEWLTQNTADVLARDINVLRLRTRDAS